MNNHNTDRSAEGKDSIADGGQCQLMLPRQEETITSTEATNKEHAIKCDTDGVPYDRGWAWMVVFGNLINYILVSGYVKTSGVFFVELLRHFQAPASKTALLFGIRCGVYSVSGLFVMNSVVGRLGCKKTALIGAALMVVSAILSSQANELTLLICLQAIPLGVADSILTAPGEVLTARYFKRHRSLALAIEKLGASLGSITYPPLLALLLSRYGLRGALLLTGAISLHALPASLLLRPVSSYRTPGSKRQEGATEGSERASPRIKSHFGHNSSCADETWRCERETNCGQETDRGGRETTNDTQTGGREVICAKKNGGCEKEAKYEDKTTGNKREATRRHSEREPPRNQCETESATDDADTEQPLLEGLQRWRSASGRLGVNTVCMRQESQNTAEMKQKGDSNESDYSKRGRCNDEYLVSYSIDAKMRSSPALFGPETELKTVDSLLGSRRKTDSNESEHHNVTRMSSFLLKFRSAVSVLDFSLFRRKSFRLFFAYFMLAPTINVSLDYLPALAQQNGLSQTQAAQLLSIAGGVDLGGRIVSGLLVGLGVVSAPAIVAVCLAVLGTVYQSVGVLSSFPLMAVLSAVHGVMSGVVNCMVVVLVVHVAGLPDMAEGMGFQILAEGAFLAGFHPLCGYIRDLTGSYVAVYHAIGCALLMAAALLVGTELLRRREERQGRESGVQSAA